MRQQKQPPKTFVNNKKSAKTTKYAFKSKTNKNGNQKEIISVLSLLSYSVILLLTPRFRDFQAQDHCRREIVISRPSGRQREELLSLYAVSSHALRARQHSQSNSSVNKLPSSGHQVYLDPLPTRQERFHWQLSGVSPANDACSSKRPSLECKGCTWAQSLQYEPVFLLLCPQLVWPWNSNGPNCGLRFCLKYALDSKAVPNISQGNSISLWEICIPARGQSSQREDFWHLGGPMYYRMYKTMPDLCSLEASSMDNQNPLQTLALGPSVRKATEVVTITHASLAVHTTPWYWARLLHRGKCWLSPAL